MNRRGHLGKRKASGFTLVEQLIVLALIVIMAGFAAVNLSGVSRGGQMDTAVKDLSTLLRFLQMKAIDDGQIYELTVNADMKHFSVKRSAPTRSARFEAVSLPIVRAVQPASAVSMQFERESRLLFYPDGSTSKNRLVLMKSGGSDKIYLKLKNRIGAIEVQSNVYPRGK